MGLKRIDPVAVLPQVIEGLNATNQKKCAGLENVLAKKSKQLGLNCLAAASGVAAVARETFVIVGVVVTTPAKLTIVTLRVFTKSRTIEKAHRKLSVVPSFIRQTGRVGAQALGICSSLLGATGVLFFLPSSEWNVRLQMKLGNVVAKTHALQALGSQNAPMRSQVSGIKGMQAKGPAPLPAKASSTPAKVTQTPAQQQGPTLASSTPAKVTLTPAQQPGPTLASSTPAKTTLTPAQQPGPTLVSSTPAKVTLTPTQQPGPTLASSTPAKVTQTPAQQLVPTLASHSPTHVTQTQVLERQTASVIAATETRFAAQMSEAVPKATPESPAPTPVPTAIPTPRLPLSPTFARPPLAPQPPALKAPAVSKPGTSAEETAVPLAKRLADTKSALKQVAPAAAKPQEAASSTPPVPGAASYASQLNGIGQQIKEVLPRIDDDARFSTQPKRRNPDNMIKPPEFAYPEEDEWDKPTKSQVATPDSSNLEDPVA